MNDPFDAVRQRRAAVEAARAALETADAELRRTVVDAYRERGRYTVDDLAEAAALSRARIYQLVQEAGR